MNVRLLTYENVKNLAQRHAQADGDFLVRPSHFRAALAQLQGRERNPKPSGGSLGRRTLRVLAHLGLRLGVPRRYILWLVPRG